MRRAAGYTAVVLTTLAILYLLWQFRLIVVLFTVSLFVAAAVRPSIRYLTQYRLSPLAARLLVYTLLIAGFLLLSYVLSEPLSREVRLLSNRTAVAYQLRYSQWSVGTEWQQGLVSQLPDPEALFDTAVGEEGEQLLQTLLNITQALFTLLGGAITVIILSIYWSVDQDRFERLGLSVLPPDKRIHAREGWHELETNVSDYLRNQFIQSLLAATLLGLGYWMMGLSYPILLAILAAIAWLIPLAGVVLIAVPAFFVGFNVNVMLGVGALLYTLVIILFLEIVVEPSLFDRRRYSTFLLLITMTCLVDAFGFIGFIVAPPVAAAIQVLAGQVFRYTVRPAAAAVHVNQLEQRYQDIRQQFHNGQSPTPEIGNLLERLEKLLHQAQQLSS